MITDFYPPIAVGGYEISCKETADELSRRGHDVVVLTSKWKVEHTRAEGNVHRLLFFKAMNDLRGFNFSGPFRLCKRYRQFRWAFMSRKNYKITCELIATMNPDLIIVWNMGNVGIGPVLAAQDQDIPRVYNIEDNWLLRLKSETYDSPNLIKRKFRSAIEGLKDFRQLDLKHLLLVSNTLKEAYIRNGFREEDIHLIPIGLQSNWILPVTALGDLPRKHNDNIGLLFVGRMIPAKGPDVALKALAALRQKYGERNFKLDLIGQGQEDYTLRLKNMVLELGLEKNVNFLGWLEHSVILDKYPDYDMLLFPSRWEEPFGKTVLEAMARGLPVIASKRGGPQEIINDGENGLLVPADDPAAFARAILKLLQSDDLTQNIRIAGIRTIKERYTLEHITDQNLDYFQTVMATSCRDKALKRT